MEDDSAISLDGKTIANLRVVDLKQELEKRGLSKSGSKKDLIKRLKQQLDFEKLSNPEGDSNFSLDAVTEQNQFVQQYLAQQQKIIAEQKEVKRLVEQEIQRSSDEREVTTDEASDSENTFKPPSPPPSKTKENYQEEPSEVSNSDINLEVIHPAINTITHQTSEADEPSQSESPFIVPPSDSSVQTSSQVAEVIHHKASVNRPEESQVQKPDSPDSSQVTCSPEQEEIPQMETTEKVPYSLSDVQLPPSPNITKIHLPHESPDVVFAKKIKPTQSLDTNGVKKDKVASALGSMQETSSEIKSMEVDDEPSNSVSDATEERKNEIELPVKKRHHHEQNPSKDSLLSAREELDPRIRKHPKIKSLPEESEQGFSEKLIEKRTKKDRRSKHRSGSEPSSESDDDSAKKTKISTESSALQEKDDRQEVTEKDSKHAAKESDASGSDSGSEGERKKRKKKSKRHHESGDESREKHKSRKKHSKKRDSGEGSKSKHESRKSHSSNKEESKAKHEDRKKHLKDGEDVKKSRERHSEKVGDSDVRERKERSPSETIEAIQEEIQQSQETERHSEEKDAFCMVTDKVPQLESGDVDKHHDEEAHKHSRRKDDSDVDTEPKIETEDIDESSKHKERKHSKRKDDLDVDTEPKIETKDIDESSKHKERKHSKRKADSDVNSGQPELDTKDADDFDMHKSEHIEKDSSSRDVSSINADQAKVETEEADESDKHKSEHKDKKRSRRRNESDGDMRREKSERHSRRDSKSRHFVTKSPKHDSDPEKESEVHNSQKMYDEKKRVSKGEDSQDESEKNEKQTSEVSKDILVDMPQKKGEKGTGDISEGEIEGNTEVLKSKTESDSALPMDTAEASKDSHPQSEESSTDEDSSDRRDGVRHGSRQEEKRSSHGSTSDRRHNISEDSKYDRNSIRGEKEKSKARNSSKSEDANEPIPAKKRNKIKRDNVIISRQKSEDSHDAHAISKSYRRSTSETDYEAVPPLPKEAVKKELPTPEPYVPPQYTSRKISLTNRKKSMEEEPQKKKGKWGNLTVVQKNSSVSISSDSIKTWFPNLKLINAPVLEEELSQPETKELSEDISANQPEASPLEEPVHQKQAEEEMEAEIEERRTSQILLVNNLVRPFTLNQLKDLLRQTGNIVEEEFWIDKIKSKCVVTYETEEEALTTKVALHNTRWPPSNPKILNVHFSSKEELQLLRSGIDPSKRVVEVAPPPPQTYDQSEVPIRTVHHERLRPDHPPPGVSTKERERPELKEKRRFPMREWDRDKIRQETPEREREKELHRRRREEERIREAKKKVADETPAKLLDDLFKKTKCMPCIYWLPLTEEQAAARDAVRQKKREEREKLRKEMQQSRTRSRSPVRRR